MKFTFEITTSRPGYVVGDQTATEQVLFIRMTLGLTAYTKGVFLRDTPLL